jgi:hypothetical protein
VPGADGGFQCRISSETLRAALSHREDIFPDRPLAEAGIADEAQFPVGVKALVGKSGADSGLAIATFVTFRTQPG